MCLHEKRILTIPSDLAYGQLLDQFRGYIAPYTSLGDRGFGTVIPAGSALVFDVELLGLEPTGPREEL